MAPVSNSVARVSSSYYISNEGLLQEKVDRFWKLESSGIYEQEKSMSVDDRRVLALWDEKSQLLRRTLCPSDPF